MTKLATVNIKGKNYVTVNTRVMALRQEHPDWRIDTEIDPVQSDIPKGICVIKATVLDEKGEIRGTGYAYEKESSSFINKTSFVENCETSAVGRAIGFATGIGIEDSFASAEEVANAQLQQEDMKDDSRQDKKLITLISLIDISKPGMEQRILKKYSKESLGDLTEEEIKEATKALEDARKKALNKQHKEQEDSFQAVLNGTAEI